MVSLVHDKFVKWLGVHFDRKLLFNNYVKVVGARGGNAVNSPEVLSNTVRGLSQVYMRRLYLSCFVPKLLTLAPPGGKLLNTKLNRWTKSKETT
jgi:hypothetical protein